MAYTYFDLDVARQIGSTLTGNVTWTDNSKAIFGTGGDATISYDGTNFLVNPAVVGSGEFRVGTASNYMAIQADGDMKFAGTAQFRVGTTSAAFVADALPAAGLFFVATGGGTYSFTDGSGVQIAGIILDSAAIFNFGTAYPATSPAQITANQNNYAGAGEAAWARINSDAARDITGWVAAADGQSGKRVYVTNTGSFTITFKHLNASSTIIHRFIGIAAADVALAAGENLLMMYDGTSNRWRILFKQ